MCGEVFFCATSLKAQPHLPHSTTLKHQNILIIITTIITIYGIMEEGFLGSFCLYICLKRLLYPLTMSILILRWAILFLACHFTSSQCQAPGHTSNVYCVHVRPTTLTESIWVVQWKVQKPIGRFRSQLGRTLGH